MKTNGVPPQLARSSAQSISRLGMVVLLVSLSVLFVASLLAYLLVRWLQIRHGQWPPPGVAAIHLPPGLWLSTGVLLLSSATLEYALARARRDDQRGIRIGMLLTLALGLAFVVNQVMNWAGLLGQIRAAHIPLQGLFFVGFYFLTALHAAHVLGGIGPMASVTYAAFRGYYVRTAHHGLRLLAMYWHFLAIVWVVLFTVLMLR